eukprot:scaffold10383_cov117-Isochrysis_galbana.AAC.7
MRRPGGGGLGAAPSSECGEAWRAGTRLRRRLPVPCSSGLALSVHAVHHPRRPGWEPKLFPTCTRLAASPPPAPRRYPPADLFPHTNPPSPTGTDPPDPPP